MCFVQDFVKIVPSSQSDTTLKKAPKIILVLTSDRWLGGDGTKISVCDWLDAILEYISDFLAIAALCPELT